MAQSIGDLMRTEDFRHWLRHVYVTRDGTRLKEKVISSRISNCENVERHEGDLDQHAAEDRLAGLLSRLAYSTDDQRRGQPPRHRVPIDGDFRTGSAASAARSPRCRTLPLNASSALSMVSPRCPAVDCQCWTAMASMG